jgi:very-short-patch-repair endonuclease
LRARSSQRTLPCVPRRAHVPIELTRGPFTVEDARRAGLSRGQLAGRAWRRIGPAIYVWSGLRTGPALALAATQRRLTFPAVFSGLTAAWLHGLDAESPEPIEVTVPAGCGTSGRVGMLIRRAILASDEIVTRHGVPTTSGLRTLADLSLRLPLSEAVVVADSAYRLELIKPADVEMWVAKHAGRKGVRRMRQILDLAEPASESPMESRLRMLLVLSGMPRPQVQAELSDDLGRFVARADLYYPQRRLAIEYDGATHRDSLLEDNRRQNRLLSAGYRLLRFASGDVLRAPQTVVSEVRSALSQAA